MKTLLIGFLALGTISAQASELQIAECKFGETVIDFKPSSALTTLLKEEVKGSTVYKVVYKRGSMTVGPTNDLAVIDELPSKTLGVSFFDFDAVDGVEYSKANASIDLKSPVGVEDNMIKFEASINDDDATEGTCSLSF